MDYKRIKGVFFRYFYNLLKGPQQLSDLFYWPFIDILIWGLTSLWVQQQSTQTNVPLILMTALVFWQVLWRGSIDISVSLLVEFWHRNLMNLFSTPLKLSEWILGILIFSVAKLIVTVLFGSLVVYLLYSVNIFTIGLVFVPCAILLFIFGWTLGLIASSAIIYWGHQVEMLAWMVAAAFIPFSAVYYPIQTLPSWAQTIAWCLPSTYIFEGMRLILSGAPLPASYMLNSAFLNIMYLLLSLALFKYMFEKSRMKGLGRLE